MPRKARIDAPGALHHLICRGIERRKIFLDDTDRDRFLERLGELLIQTDTPCYTWVLVPNHFHLLIKTGLEPLSRVMRRLLTGYAITFNRRHRRSGRLFQNRFKSILCQEDSYLLELVRYIHLNPIRAGLVPDLKTLDRFAYSGHSTLVGKRSTPWQDTASVLRHFSKKPKLARQKYRSFVEKGIKAGKRPELTGGGLIRSVGGWGALKSKRRMEAHVKGDERILGDSDFVESVLKAASEQMERRYCLQSKGFTLDTVIEKVGKIFGMSSEEICTAGKQPLRVQARSIVVYWSIQELRISSTEVGKRLNLSRSAVSRASVRGHQLVVDRSLTLET